MAEKEASEPRFDVTTLGETMLRLSVPAGVPLAEARALELHPGGAESNVCAALACLDRRCGWVSALPEGPLGELVLRRLRAAHIDTSAVVTSLQGRVGTYYVEFAAPPRAPRVLYDRAHSAVARLGVEDVDWDYLLGARILHLTGITPALSENLYTVVGEAMRRAKERGVTVSFDVNYRRKLWPVEKAASHLRTLFPFADLLICGEADAAELFGLAGSAREVLEGLQRLTPARRLVLTQGERGASALEDDELFHEAALETQPIDRLGAGDAFAAGVLDGVLDNSLTEGLRRGVALAALAISQHGDMVVTNREEMNALQDAPPTRIQR